MAQRDSDVVNASPVAPDRPLGLPGLFDIVLEPAHDGGLASPGGDGRSLTARELAEVIRRGGGRDTDVRVLMADGGDFLSVLAATARELERDILVAPTGADLSQMPSFADSGDSDDQAGSAGRTGRHDVVPVDRASGYPVDWLVVQPADAATSRPGWFDLVGGMVLPRTGLVSLPLPGGLSLATRADYVRRRSASVRLGAAHPGLITVAVAERDGQFVIGEYNGQSTVVDGVGLAAALPPLPLHGSDLRLWLSWPDTVDSERRLRSNLFTLADTTGAVVWTPPTGGRAEIIPACRDLAALDRYGAPGTWESFQRPPRVPPRFESDLDGRLMPVGGPRWDRYHGVALVSVPPARAREMSAQYEQLRARPGTFVADLPVLDDGRLAARGSDGTLLALGPRQLRALLESAGWSGGDIALLSEVPPERVDGFRRHIAVLCADLECDISVSTPGALTGVRSGVVAEQRHSENTPPAVAEPSDAGPEDVGPEDVGPEDVGPEDVEPLDPGPDSADPEQARRLAELSRKVAEYLTTEKRIAATTQPEAADLNRHAHLRDVIVGIVAAAGTGVDLAGVDLDPLALLAALTRRPADAPAVAAEPSSLPIVTEPLMPVHRVRRPTLVTAARSAAPHGVAWLPEQPQVNAEAVDLYVTSAVEPGVAITEGIPGPDLFLLGRLDHRRLAAEQTGGYLLRVRVEPGGAVDVTASEVRPPSDLQHQLSRTDVYLLPAGWLGKAHATGGFAVESDGYPRELPEPLDGPISVRSAGARHGATGLPNDVERWPRSRLRSGTVAYGIIHDGQHDWIELFRRRPAPRSGARLVDLEIGRGRAIDVVATQSRLAAMPLVRTGVPALRERGVELILPSRSYNRVTVLRAFESDGDRWREVPSATLDVLVLQAPVL